MTDNITTDQAQTLFEDSYKAIKSGETPTTTTVVEEPAPAEAVEETPTESPEVAEVPEKKEEAPVAESTPTDADPYAWLKEVPETLRQKVMEEINTKLRLEHRVRSDDGRVRAHQEKVLKLQRMLAEAQHRPAASAQSATAANQVPEAWQQIVKSDPELAAAFEARVKQEVDSAVGSVRNELQEFKRTAVEPLYEHNSQQYVEEQKQTLRSMVPNYEQVVASPEYNDWLNNYASEGIRRLALTSLDAQDAYNVLRYYANDMVAMGKAPTSQQPTTVQQAPTSEAADKIAAERAGRLAATPPAQRTVPIAPTGNPAKTDFTRDEAEAIFAEEWKKLNKRT